VQQPRLTSVAAAALLLMACGRANPPGEPGSKPGDGTPPTARLEEVWQTERDTLDNIDSPAVWHGPDGQHWLLSTAKSTDVLVVNDAATGKELRRVGGSGTALGKMERPNGIAVIDDLALVVERDNHRVQVFRMPSFTPLGTFGASVLKKPYGIAVYPAAEAGGAEAGGYVAYVTDNYELTEDVVPPDSMLGERVRQFRVTIAPDTLSAELVGTFGDTAGPGVLKVVESIAADVPNNRLLIAEELETGSHIKVYSLDGRFTGQIIDSGLFPHQAEGIILYACGDTAGYWITTDQDLEVNTFHVFDRQTLEHVGSFRGARTLNTDGIALTQRGFADFPSGAFYAVHNDGNVAAFSWEAIADSLDLRKDCELPPGAAESAS
jgi:3-phytase